MSGIINALLAGMTAGFNGGKNLFLIKTRNIKNFSTLFFLFSFLFLGNSGLFSQKIVEITFLQDAKNAYVFSAYNHAFCNYTLEIQFPMFINVKADKTLPLRVEVRPGMNKLFSLTALNPNEAVKFNYSSNNYKGCMQVTTDTAFPYLLPIGTGKEAQVYEMSNQNGGQNNWYGIRIKMKPEDTIYAARRGVVTEVLEGDTSNDAGVASAGHENYIEIVHADCTFGHYGILRRNGSLVRPGQLVKAGEPIGLVGGDPYGRGSEIRFSVYYNQVAENSMKPYMVYVPYQCWTKNNGKGRLKHGALYSSEFPLAIVNREEAKKPRKGEIKPVKKKKTRTK